MSTKNTVFAVESCLVLLTLLLNLPLKKQHLPHKTTPQVQGRLDLIDALTGKELVTAVVEASETELKVGPSQEPTPAVQFLSDELLEHYTAKYGGEPSTVGECNLNALVLNNGD